MSRAPRHEVDDISRHTADQAGGAVDRGMALFGDPRDKVSIAAHCIGVLMGKLVVAHSVARGISIEAAKLECADMVIASPLGGERGRASAPGLDTVSQQKEG